MQFTNETIDTTDLPRFEEVQFTKLHRDYWKVLLITQGIIFGALSIVLALLLIFNEQLVDYRVHCVIGFIVLLGIILLFSRISFSKKGFAFREHDVLFRDGIISTNTLIIPYNRVQHVALHEGAISRIFGLAKVEVFTAGGSQGDINIPGIKKEQAENIKQLLMGKILKEL